VIDRHTPELVAGKQFSVFADALLAEKCGAARHMLMDKNCHYGKYPPNQEQTH